MDDEIRRQLEDLLLNIQVVRAEVLKTRGDLMARIDRLQDALTLQREEKIVDQSTILLMRRQIQHLEDRVQTLEEKR